MNYTQLYPKLLESRSSNQIEASSAIRERVNRSRNQEKRYFESRDNSYQLKVTSAVDAFLIKAIERR